jgi:FKBP-type peptidyl-prolyl cis-trans isomerase
VEISVNRILLPAALLLLVAPLVAQDPTIPPDTEVQTTASGLKYCVLEAGEPEGAHPREFDAVKVHYTGWLTDGKVFDSSVRRGEPARFPLGNVIKGWTEGLQLMTPGARYKFTIPGELAYGNRGQSGAGIGPNATLIFEVKLLEILRAPDFRKGNPEAQKTTESGLKYELLKPGKGEAPTKKDAFELGYALWTTEGRLLDCTEWLDRTIKGDAENMGLDFLKEAPFLLAPGARARFEVPAALCFKDKQKGPIAPNSVTVWELEMKRVVATPEFSVSPADKVKSTATGLKYEVIREGTGESPKMGSEVTVHYAGWLTDGTRFDSSYSRCEPATFRLGNVIKGWNEGLQLMKEGAIYKFTIPADLAYGESGAGDKIGPNATLIFHVELVKVGK